MEKDGEEKNMAVGLRRVFLAYDVWAGYRYMNMNNITRHVFAEQEEK